MDVFLSLQSKTEENKIKQVKKKFEPENILVVAIYKNTSQGQPQLAMMIRIFCVCGEGRGREESLDQWTTL